MLSGNFKAPTLTRDELIKAVPAVTALAPHYSRSERYGHATTLDVVDAMLANGYQIASAYAATVRKVDRVGYQRHMVRMRQPVTDLRQIGDALPEVSIVNSHDGTSSFQVSAGLLRIVCLNGLMVGTAWQDYRIAHRSNIVPKVIDAAFTVVSQFNNIGERVGHMQRLQLTSAQQSEFAERAHALRYGTDDEDDDATTATNPAEPRPARILPSPDMFLRPRRWDDTGNDLWTTYNRVQENVIRGGIVSVGRMGRRWARRTSRAVKTIDGSVKINRGLWDIAESMLAAA